MKVCQSVKESNTRHSKLRIVDLIAVLWWMKAKFSSIVDDFPPKNREKVKLHKVKVSYCFFSFDLRKISTWYSLILSNKCLEKVRVEGKVNMICTTQTSEALTWFNFFLKWRVSKCWWRDKSLICLKNYIRILLWLSYAKWRISEANSHDFSYLFLCTFIIFRTVVER